MYYALQDAFIWRKPLSVLRDSYITNKLAFRDLSTLGVFLDNHDVERVLNQLSKLSPEESKATLLNMLTYQYMSYGIPMLYYGTEALFTGGKDPEIRNGSLPSIPTGQAWTRP
jgi:alpha-amylase